MDLTTALVELEKIWCDILLKWPTKFQDNRSLIVQYHEKVWWYLMDVRKDISKDKLEDIIPCIQAISKDLKKLNIRTGTD